MKKTPLTEPAHDGEYMLTVPEAARRLGVSTSTMERMIQSGEIKSRLFSRRCRRISHSALLRHMVEAPSEDESPVAQEPRVQFSFLRPIQENQGHG